MRTFENISNFNAVGGMFAVVAELFFRSKKFAFVWLYRNEFGYGCQAEWSFADRTATRKAPRKGELSDR